MNYSINSIIPKQYKSLLITGANGFVGSHIVEAALSVGVNVYANVRETSDRTFLKKLPIHFIDLFFADVEKLTKQLKQYKTAQGSFDYVVHCAGIVNTTDKKQFEYINFEYSKNLIDALIAADMIPQKFVYISSLSAFGAGDAKTMHPIMHDDLPHPNTAYGQSKLKTEQYLYSLPASFPFIILRPTGIYGERDKAYLTYYKMVNKGFVPQLGRTPQYITFIHVKDMAQATIAALKSPLARRAYFVADGDVYTTNEFAAIVQKHLGKKHVLRITIPLWLAKIIFYMADILFGRFGYTIPSLNIDKYNILTARNWICDTEPIRCDLHFTPSHSLDGSMNEILKYYRNQKML